MEAATVAVGCSKFFHPYTPIHLSPLNLLLATAKSVAEEYLPNSGDC